MSLTADEAVLRRAVGTETLARGRQYATCGAVLTVQWAPAGDRVFGQVLGSAARPYSAIAILESAADGALRSFAGACTCPVGTDCKHSVALALARPRAAVRPSWEDRLADLGTDSHAPDAPAAVALQFELQADPRSGHATGDGRATGLLVRPVLRGRSGSWVRTGISWSTLHLHSAGSYTHDPVNPRHLRLLNEIAALESSGSGGYGRYWAATPTAIDLADFPTRRLWDVLAEAAEAGLPLVEAGKHARSVRLHREPVELRLDLDRDDTSLTVAPALAAAGEQWPACGALLLGRPAHGVAVRGTTDLHLAPLLDEPDPLLTGLLGAEPLTIPHADEQRFVSTYLPGLRRRIAVTSASGAVELPEVHRPELVLVLDQRQPRTVRLTWRWQYCSGTTVHDLALWPAASARTERDTERDARAEAHTLAPVLEALAAIPAAFESAGSGAAAGRRLAAEAVVTDMTAVRLVTECVPRLEQLADVSVEFLGDPVEYRPLDGATGIAFTDETDGDQRDWFDLSVRVTIGDHELPFERLFVALATGETHLLLDDGHWLDLDRPELRELGRVIAEARTVHDQPRRAVRVSRYQAGLWDDLDSVGQLTGRAAGWQQTVRALSDVTRLADVPPPEGLHAQLRPYQLDGLRWLAFLHQHGLGGVLADDMGLGKTLQTLALILRAVQAAPSGPPFLIVAPTTVMSNWQAESARFAPSLRTAVITETHARRRQPLAIIAADADIVITSYTLFRLEHDGYTALPWSGLVLDEAQAAKNHQSRNYACAKQLDAPFKLAITGTPMENHLGELWSLLSIAAPGLFPTPARFDELYRRPIERDRNAERLDSLRRRIRPVMLRRTKDEVAADLPDKQEQVLEVDLHPRHRRAYETLLHRERQKVLGLLDDLDTNRFEILRSLTLLRQACLDISLVDPAGQSIPATKLDVLIELLTGIVDDGHRTLVFSQFTRFLRAARDRLEIAGIPYCYLDGSTRDRPRVIEAFKSGTAPVFLISLKAGGVGLNLTEADYCVLLDPWWNPATEAQAIDRTHRIGQTRKVMVYRMVAKQTVEEKVAALKDRKAALFADVLGEGAFSGARLSASDIRAMLD